MQNTLQLISFLLLNYGFSCILQGILKCEIVHSAHNIDKFYDI